MYVRPQTVSFWQRAHHGDDLTCDVAVVGGGVTGTSTAFWLKRLQPGLRVCLVEGGRLAQGATGRNAGFLMQGTPCDYMTALERYGPEWTRRLWQFTMDNRELVFAELDADAFALEASGGLAVAGTEAEEERLRASVAHLRSIGVPAAFLPRDEINRRLAAQGLRGGLFLPNGATVDSVAMVHHLARRSGATILEHHRVFSLSTDEQHVRLATSARGVVARRVVLAINAFLPLLYPSLKRFVRPVRAQMLALQPSARWLQHPVSSHDGFFYSRQAPGGSVLVGGARHLREATEVGYEDATTQRLQADLERYAHTHFPRTHGLGVTHRWSGVMGFSPDHLPVVGDVPGLPGSLWAAGFSGHGMAFGFRFGRMLAETMLQKMPPQALELFTAHRFGAASLMAANDA